MPISTVAAAQRHGFTCPVRGTEKDALPGTNRFVDHRFVIAHLCSPISRRSSESLSIAVCLSVSLSVSLLRSLVSHCNLSLGR